MKYWERELTDLIAAFEDQFGHGPTAILAWNDAYRRIRNVAVQRYSGKIIWKGFEVLRVDAPGDRIILDGGRVMLDFEEW